MLPRIIAVCGARRSGKDAVSSILSSIGYEHIKISAALKESCKILFDFTDDQLESDIKDEIDPRWGVTPRSMMQYLGTEVMQYGLPQTFPQMALGREFWIRRTMESMSQSHDNSRYVISDLRFLHEERLLRTRKDTFIIKVHRDHARGLDEHCSEQEFKYIRENLLIQNNFMTLDELEVFIRSQLDKLERTVE